MTLESACRGGSLRPSHIWNREGFAPRYRRALLRASAFVLVAASLVGATREPVRTKQAMVVATEQNAVRVGVEVLRSGGNAIDSAIAVGFALAATYPRAGNLGGGGFMLIRFADGKTTFIDFRETAPAAATRDMYLDAEGKPTDDSVIGRRAAGVPGTVRGFEVAWRKYGSKKWRELVDPAQDLAEKGFSLTRDTVEAMEASERLPQFPESKRIFLDGGAGFEPGDRLRQRDLGRTLRRIARRGADEFYVGETAKRIASDMESHGGLITLNDLEAYKPVEREPLRGTYRDLEIWSAPPPSSGGAGVIQILNMLEGSSYAKAGAGSAATIHYVAETMRRFFADRAEYFGDADFVDIPLGQLLDKGYAVRRRKSIDPLRASSSRSVGAGTPLSIEATETTHYSVVDAQGNAVSVTYTLNGNFGSGVTVPGTGVLLNNEMDDFTAKPGEPNMFGLLQSEKNAIEPGKRPLSAMSPTIITKQDKLFLVLGAPGGPTIISTVLQTILNVVDHGMNLRQAVDYPRFHHQWMPDELRVEEHGLSPDTHSLLQERGHKLRSVETMGRVMAIQVGDGFLLGAADARSEGLAAGY